MLSAYCVWIGLWYYFAHSMLSVRRPTQTQHNVRIKLLSTTFITCSSCAHSFRHGDDSVIYIHIVEFANGLFLSLPPIRVDEAKNIAYKKGPTIHSDMMVNLFRFYATVASVMKSVNVTKNNTLIMDVCIELFCWLILFRVFAFSDVITTSTCVWWTDI